MRIFLVGGEIITRPEVNPLSWERSIMNVRCIINASEEYQKNINKIQY